MNYKRIILIFILLLTIVTCVSAVEYPYRVFMEASVTSIVQSQVPGSFIISPDGLRYAYITVEREEQKVVADGQKHRGYQEIANLCFSPDGGHLAYVAKRNSKYFLIIDGIEGNQYDAITRDSISFSPDGKRYAFVGKTGDKWLAVTENGTGKAYDEINSGLLKYSPDSLNLAYPARIGDKWTLVINGQEGKTYDEIKALVFSPDSNRMAAVVRNGNELAVLIDGEAGPAFPEVKPESLVFSPDSQQLGYIAADQGREFVVLNHQAEKAYDQIVSGQIAFSPDSRKVAYAARLQESQFVVADGAEGKPYAAIMETPPVFSPDSEKMAYTAFNGTDWMVVLDGTEQSGYSAIGKGSLQFGKKGSRLAYIAKTNDGKWTVVVDGFAGRYYDAIGQNSLTFSPDGKNVVYSAKQGDKWMVILDNQEGRLFDGIISGGDNRIRFKGPAFFYYYALDGQQLLAIQERIASKSDFKDFQQPTTVPETDTAVASPIPEFKFQFNPPDRLTFIETSKTVDTVQSEFMNQQLREEEIKIQTEIHKNSSGYQINYLILQYHLNDVEDQAGGEALSALEGVKFSAFVDPKGFLTGFDGLEDFDRKLKTIPGRHYRKYKGYYTKEALETRLKGAWKASVENFIGKSFRLGDVWETNVKIPLPNGEISEVATAITFKEETNIGAANCILIWEDYDLNSSNLKQLIIDMIKNGIPQLLTEPEVEMSCSGKSVVDPNTLLGYSAGMEMIMKALIDIPNLGKKEFNYKRTVDVVYEFPHLNKNSNKTATFD